MIEYTTTKAASSIRQRLSAFLKEPSAVGSAAPKGMFERFTGDARRKVVESQELAFALSLGTTARANHLPMTETTSGLSNTPFGAHLP